MRYAHMVSVYESLGWKVEETDTGIAVMAGPVDPEGHGTGFIRIDTKVGPMDDRRICLEQCAKALADQMLVATWSVVSNHMEPETEEKEPESQIIIPSAVPTEAI